jgi:hypothetical protein
MTRASELREACDHGDEVVIERLGWRAVLEALRMWPRRMTWTDLAPYAIALGDEDPEAIVAAVRGLASSEYRPSASQVFAALEARPAQPDSGRIRPPRPDRAAHTYVAVRMAAAAGEPICDCHPRLADLLIDRDGVLRCPACRGLEVGQYDGALAELDESAESA